MPDFIQRTKFRREFIRDVLIIASILAVMNGSKKRLDLKVIYWRKKWKLKKEEK